MTPTSTHRTRRSRASRSAEPPAGPPRLGSDECQALLDCARAALAVATGARPPAFLQDVVDATVGLDQPGRAFVTLTEGDRLRGCMGTLDPERSMRDSVVTAATLAALDDPRFRTVTADELPGIHVAVSVMGPSRPFRSVEAFRPGIDGVIVQRDWHAALLLPEVAPEFGWDAVGMLDAVCRKAGLPTNAWADRGTRVLTFETVRFDGAAVG